MLLWSFGKLNINQANIKLYQFLHEYCIRCKGHTDHVICKVYTDVGGISFFTRYKDYLRVLYTSEVSKYWL